MTQEYISQEKSRESESKNTRRVFIDLGSGLFTAAFSGNRALQDNDYYIGVDNNRKKIQAALTTHDIAANKKNFDNIGKNVFFVQGNGGELPFADSSADEVFLGNVLGDRAIHSVDAFLTEARRILKTDGKLVILETITPSAAKERDNSNDITHFVENFGFKKIREVGFDDDNFEQERATYATHMSEYLDDDSRLLFFVKTDAQELEK